MGSFVVVLSVFVGLGFLLRYLRRREVEAFMRADMAALAEVAQTPAGVADAANVIPVAIAARVAPRSDAESPAVVPPPALASLPARPAAIQYQPRAHLFEPIHRDFLVAIERLLGPRQRVFVQVPLRDLVSPKAHTGQVSGDMRLRNTVLTFAIVDASHLTLLAGVYVSPASNAVGNDGTHEEDFIRDIFQQCQWPLLVLPPTVKHGVAAVAERLVPYLSAEEAKPSDVDSAPLCPRCAAGMQQRRVAKGQYAGQSVWICSAYPGCKGLVR